MKLSVALKVLGRIKGIVNSSQSLDEYFMAAVEMSNIVAIFYNEFGISEDQPQKREEHYQVSKSKNKIIQSNVHKISEVLILSQGDTKRFLRMPKIGTEKYRKLMKERIDGEDFV